MRLGISYTVFDGVELLESAIKQIRHHVDFIHVAYQEKSWFGHPMNPGDIEELKRLVKLKFIDSLEEFRGFKPIKPEGRGIIQSKQYETQKRQMGLDACLRKACTHFISMDVDEFYKTEEFKAAKDLIIRENISLSSCRFINYVKDPTYTRGYDGATVPFICKISYGSRMNKRFFTRCDPTRGVTKTVPGKNLQLPPNLVTMHHMETVRKDLHKKYAATTRAIFKRGRTNQLVNNIRSVNEDNTNVNFSKIIFPSLGNMKLTRTENIFNIPYRQWQELR